MLAVRRISSLQRFEFKAFVCFVRFLNNKTSICPATGKSCHLLIFNRLQFYQGAPLSKKLCTVSNTLDDVSYHSVADETLDAVAELFEDLGESPSSPSDYDVHLSDGVLTVNLGAGRGTYVINKQSPNKQIWLSSPTRYISSCDVTSPGIFKKGVTGVTDVHGPKRYDFMDNSWVYSHDGVSLHSLLSMEISNILGLTVDFTSLSHGGTTDGKRPKS